MSGQLSPTNSSNNMPSQPVTRSNGTNPIRPGWRRYQPSMRSTFIILFFLLSLLMNGGLKPQKRGFFCNDTTIQYPFMPDTVSFFKLIIIALFIPWILIRQLEKKLQLAIDKNRSRPRSRSIQGPGESSSRSRAEEQALMEFGERVKRRLVINEADDSDSDSQIRGVKACDEPAGNGVDREQSNLGTAEFKVPSSRDNSIDRISDVQIYLLGLSTCAFLTGVGKMAGGRYRPHFMQRCQPDVECSLPANINRYIEDFRCTNELLRPRDFSYITTSWPSGHASMMFYSMLYLIHYMNTVITAINYLRPNRKFRSKLSPLFVSGTYVLMVGLATYVSITRVSDYHHHPTDVLSGVILGIIIAYAFAGHLSRPKFDSILPVIK